jgi:ribonuclease BN (tRNA processing enzyme)
MKVTMLGTGTPTPSLKRASSGYLIDVAGDVLVIDHGPGANRRLMQAGRRVTDVTHLFFSHLHYDHCMEYPHLLLQRWDIGANLIPDLQVFGPPPLARMTDLAATSSFRWS